MKELMESYLATAELIWERIEELRAQKKGKFDDDLERRIAILETEHLSLVKTAEKLKQYL